VQAQDQAQGQVQGALALQYVGVGRRFLAVLVDLVILCVIDYVISLALRRKLPGLQTGDKGAPQSNRYPYNIYCFVV
jgi:hypothetical protein